MSKCDVCSERDSVGVACSALGPFSLAYCKECATQYAEPKAFCEGLLEEIGGIDNMRQDMLDSITYYENGAYHSIRELKG